MSFMHYDAVAYLKGGDMAPDLEGVVKFYQTSRGVIVSAHIFGLPKENSSGFFAFHIHEGDNCSGAGFVNTKGHYNPSNAAHPMHAGDLPPLLSNNGEAYLEVLTNRFKINEIIGKTMVIHSKADDFFTQPAGNAGDKIACGVIMKK